MRYRRPLNFHSISFHTHAFALSVATYAIAVVTDAPDVMQLLTCLAAIMSLITLIIRAIDKIIITISKCKIDQKNVNAECEQKEKFFYRYYGDIIDKAPYMSTSTVQVLVQGLITHDAQKLSPDFADDIMSEGNNHQLHTPNLLDSNKIVVLYQIDPKKEE